MQKNWYAVYTKPHCEKKVASLLTKREIENFCPMHYRKIRPLRRDKILREPLFKSCVFVKIRLAEIALLKRLKGVINIFYWGCEPAVIKQDEIDAIKEFTSDHRNIELNRTKVNINDVARVIDGSSYSMEGNVFVIKNKLLKVSLPSLGYIMTTKIEDESIFGSEVGQNFSHNSVRIMK